MVDRVEEENLDRRRFVRKLLTLGAAAGVAGILASDIPTKPAVEKVYAPSGSDIVIDLGYPTKNTGSSGTVLESDWANVSGIGTLNIINHGTATNADGTATGTYPTAIYGEVSDADGVPVFGNNTATSGYGSGVYGVSPSSLGAGVFGNSTDTSASGIASGVYGQSTSPGGQGVYGHAVNDTPGLSGVYGDTPSTTGGVGVVGAAIAPSGSNAGVWGYSFAPQGVGTEGTAYADGGIGVFGTSQSPGARPIVAIAASGQIANLQEWWNSSGAALSVVNASGNLGVQTSAPECFIHIDGPATADVFSGMGPHPNTLVSGSYVGPAMNFGYSGNSFGEGSGFFNVRPDPSAVAPNPSLRFMTVNNEAMIITNTGYVGIEASSPAYPLDVAGQVHATVFPTSSDMRFKEDITPIDDALGKVLQLQGVYFKWNRLHREILKRSSTLTSRQVGLIAQQVKEVLPEVVSEWADQGANDYLAVDYNRLVTVLIQAMKEQQQEIEELKRSVGLQH
jgi:hypothetical protein